MFAVGRTQVRYCGGHFHMSEARTALKAILAMDCTDIRDKRKAIALMKAIARTALKHEVAP